MTNLKTGRRVAFVLFSIFLFAACSKGYDHAGKKPLVSIGNKFLYAEDVNAALPAGLSSTDSILFVKNYIHKWLEEELLTAKAEKNISSNGKIEQLVENYRRNLILQAYQQKLVAQKLSRNIPDNEVESYYNAHTNLFLLEEPVCKGLFMKVPMNAKEIALVKRWVKSKRQSDIDALEKFSLSNAVIYDYFYDHWVTLADIAPKIPMSKDEVAAHLLDKSGIEMNDSAFWYLLHVDSVLPKGQVKPFGFAKSEITDILFNQKQVEYMNKMKADLYQEAQEDGKIKYYQKNE